MVIQIDKVVIKTEQGERKIYAQCHIDNIQQPLSSFTETELKDLSSSPELKQAIAIYINPLNTLSK